ITDPASIHRYLKGENRDRSISVVFLYSVIPAKAGIYPVHPTGITWIPAFGSDQALLVRLE
ncbi:MAG: hypothetical protein P8Y03_29320, partial [Anaerolineales bacterium]